MNTVSMESPRFEIRVGSGQDIDVLCDIDLDAGMLFEAAGLDLSLTHEQEIARNDRGRWLQSLVSGKALLAFVPQYEKAVGFAAMAMLDNEPYLDQLSVRTRFMRAGIGSALLARVASKLRSAGHSTLWLTTYAHLGWNRPFYERVGFVVVPEGDSGPQLRQELAYQRRWLPCPDQRVVMRKELARDF